MIYIVLFLLALAILPLVVILREDYVNRKNYGAYREAEDARLAARADAEVPADQVSACFLVVGDCPSLASQ